MAAALSTQDGATIVNSGSTNALGYSIEVRSDGSATVTLRNRLNAAMSTPKPFVVDKAVAAKFFADLKAARDGHAHATACMKSASFGTTTRVTWHSWTSPDLDCPPGNGLTGPLVHDVSVIREASGVSTATMLRRGVYPPR